MGVLNSGPYVRVNYMLCEIYHRISEFNFSFVDSLVKFSFLYDVNPFFFFGKIIIKCVKINFLVEIRKKIEHGCGSQSQFS